MDTTPEEETTSIILEKDVVADKGNKVLEEGYTVLEEGYTMLEETKVEDGNNSRTEEDNTLKEEAKKDVSVKEIEITDNEVSYKKNNFPESEFREETLRETYESYADANGKEEEEEQQKDVVEELECKKEEMEIITLEQTTILADDFSKDSFEWGFQPEEQEAYYDVKQLEENKLNKHNYNFYYPPSSFPCQSFTCSFPTHSSTLELVTTLGYDCQRNDNLAILTHDIIVYMAGNFVVFHNVRLNRKKFLRSRMGRGCSAIAVDGKKRHLAVGERGDYPLISIYKVPRLTLVKMLLNGTEQSFSFLEFNLDGTLLASLGEAPDYTLAIWDWKKELLTWRSKAFGQDVYRVLFSTESSSKLFTSGMGHIKFWTMADTFSGCKLQGELGKFDRVEISDIRGVAELPGDRILTSSDWGNILLWEDGICVSEVVRKEGSCHEGAIQQIYNDNGSILTIGVDGYIRVWDIEDRVSERVEDELRWVLDPLDEIKIGKNSSLKMIAKVDELDSADDSGVWMVQDMNGAVWKVDLSFQLNSFEPQKLLTAHSGGVNACVHSPVEKLLVTAGSDKTIRVHDYERSRQLGYEKYNAAASSLTWLPTTVDEGAGLIGAGFEDGVVRMVRVQAKKPNPYITAPKTLSCELALFDVIKPHNQKVTTLVFNQAHNLLVSGSLDGKIFFFRIVDMRLVQLGYLDLKDAITHLTFSEPERIEDQKILISCARGIMKEFKLSQVMSFENNDTYSINILAHNTYKFSPIKKMLVIKEKEHDKSKEKKASETQEIDMLEEEEEEEEDTVIDLEDVPETDIKFAFYGINGVFWIAMDDVDNGYLYEGSFDEDPLAAHAYHEFPDATNQTALCHVFNTTTRQHIIGLSNGALLIFQATEKDIGEFKGSFYMPLHDSRDGGITGLCCSHDNQRLITVGQDGNIMVLNYNLRMVDEEEEEEEEEEEYEEMEEEEEEEAMTMAKEEKKEYDEALILEKIKIEEDEEEDDEEEEDEQEEEKLLVKIEEPAIIIPHRMLAPDMQDILDSNFASLEMALMMKRFKELILMSHEIKTEKLETVSKMQKMFQLLKEGNRKLPEAFRMHPREFLMDPRFEEMLLKEKEDKLRKTRDKMAFHNAKIDLGLEKVQGRFTDRVACHLIKISAFRLKCFVSTFRFLNYSKELQDSAYFPTSPLHQKDSDLGSRASADPNTKSVLTLNEERSEQAGAPYTDAFARIKTFPNIRLKKLKMIEKMELQKAARIKRKQEWQEFMKSEPRTLHEEIDNEQMISEAKTNLGDLKLKTAVHSKIMNEKQLLTLDKSSKQLAELICHLGTLKHSFNRHVYQLRDRKRDIIAEWLEKQQQLQQIQQQIPSNKHKKLLPIEITLKEEEYPEAKFQLDEVLDFPNVKQTKKVEKEVEKDVSKLNEEDEFFPLVQQKKLMLNLYNQDHIIDEMEQKIRAFDNKVLYLNNIESFLLIYLKQVELRELLLVEETMKMMELLKDEEILTAKLVDDGDLQKKMDELIVKLDKHLKETTKITGLLGVQEKQFLANIPEGYKFKDFLWKVYKQKMRRRGNAELKNNADDDDDDDDDEDDEEDDEDDEDNADDDDDAYMNFDVCPEGCNIALFNKTKQMRDIRMELVDKLVENKKVKEQLTKDLEIKRKVHKTAMEEAAKTALNLDLYHVSKLKAVNEFKTIVLLVCMQIESLDDDAERINPNMDETLVVEYTQLKGLESRIRELQKEWKSQLKTIKESQEKHVTLMRSKARMMKKISEANSEVYMAMEKKFGRQVDMEKIESILITPAIEELIYDYNELRNQQFEELKHIEQRINTKHAEYLQELKVNTDIINYTLAYKDLAVELATELNIKEDELTQTKRQHESMETIDMLLAEVNMQVEEIALLKRKIHEMQYCTHSSFL